MIKKMTREQVKQALVEPNGAERLCESADAAFDAAWALFLDKDAQAAGFLCRLARKKLYRERIEALIGQGREPLNNAISSDEPKLRKNAARLMGELGNPADAQRLMQALKEEDTRFVRPSILLALGAIGGETAKKALEEHTVAPPASEYEERHFKDETEALESAKKRFISVVAHEFTGFKKPMETELITPEFLPESLVYELGRIGVKPLRTTARSVIVMEQDLMRLYECRSFFEPLIVLARNIPADPKLAAIKLREPLEKMLCESHTGEPPFGYRIELRGEVDRGAFARALAGYLDGETLINAPGAYEAELRLVFGENGGADAYVKLYTVKDTRFDYRTGALPASINPATAAAVLLYAKDALKSGARVLDPCCGSGTLLIERSKLTECASLTGVDIAHKAIDIARRNAEEAGCGAKFIVNDSLRFTADRPYDELIANLPFGNRVGTHGSNVKFYAGLVELIPKWVKKGGTAILYTMEFTLLKKLLREQPKLKLLSQSKAGAGGLVPGIFIIEVK